MTELSGRLSTYCLFFVLASMLVLAGCTTSPPPPPPEPEPEPVAAPAPLPQKPLVPPMAMGPQVGDGPVRMALLVPLSGRFAGLGEALLDAAQMALFDAGESRLVLVPIDTGGTSQGARRAMQQAIADGAHIALGPVFAESIRTIRPLARQAAIPVIGFSTDRSVAGDGVYIMGFTPEQQISRIVEHAVAEGRTKFAALVPNTAYGTSVMQAYRQAITRQGAELIQVVTFPSDETALFDPVKHLANYDARLAAYQTEQQELAAFGDDDLVDEMLAPLAVRETLGQLEFDAVLMAAGGSMIRSLAPLLPYFDIDPKDVQFLGTGLWDDPGLRHEPALLGARFAAPAPDMRANFSGLYKGVYGTNPPRIASLAYDAVALTAALLRINNRQPFTEKAITNPRGFVGMDGEFRFATDGIAQRELAIIEIGKDGLSVVKEQPDVEPLLEELLQYE